MESGIQYLGNPAAACYDHAARIPRIIHANRTLEGVRTDEKKMQSMDCSDPRRFAACRLRRKACVIIPSPDPNDIRFRSAELLK